MPLHPEAVQAIQRAGDLPADLAPVRLRQVYEQQRMLLLDEPLAIQSVHDLVVPSRGGPLSVRVYRPLAQQADVPLMVFFHGGGWMLGSLKSYDTNCRRLAAKAGCVVVSVGYRLAPEHPFPAAVEDAWDAFCWCADHANEFGASREKLIVCGDSAGGNLAAVVAQQCIDDARHQIALQILIYPSTDMVRNWPSYERNGRGNMLTAAALAMFYDKYVPNEADRHDPRASPALRSTLRNLPRALIIGAEFDPLVDDNRDYARLLQAADVPTRFVCFPGMIHPFFTLGGVISDARKLEDLVVSEIRSTVAPSG